MFDIAYAEFRVECEAMTPKVAVFVLRRYILMFDHYRDERFDYERAQHAIEVLEKLTEATDD